MHSCEVHAVISFSTVTSHFKRQKTHRMTIKLGFVAKAFLAKPEIICVALQLAGRESYKSEASK
jgi:hypothetical protein